MRCAKCRAVLRGDAEEDGRYRVVCETCGKTRKSCQRCNYQDIDECLKCLLKTSADKLDLLFGDIQPARYVERCHKVKIWFYGTGSDEDTTLCRDLVIDVKLGLPDCIKENLKKILPDELLRLLFANHENEGAAIFWLPITTTGTFYLSKHIPPIDQCILISEQMEQHFGIGKDHRAQIVDGKPLNKEEWLLATFNWQKGEVTKSPKGIDAIKAVLSNCKILHYFLIKKASFPNAPTQSMIADCEKLVELLKNEENLQLREFVEAVESYLANIKNEMNQGASQPNSNNSSKGGNSNNE